LEHTSKETYSDFIRFASPSLQSLTCTYISVHQALLSTPLQAPTLCTLCIQPPDARRKNDNLLTHKFTEDDHHRCANLIFNAYVACPSLRVLHFNQYLKNAAFLLSLLAKNTHPEKIVFPVIRITETGHSPAFRSAYIATLLQFTTHLEVVLYKPSVHLVYGFVSIFRRFLRKNPNPRATIHIYVEFAYNLIYDTDCIIRGIQEETLPEVSRLARDIPNLHIHLLPDIMH
jgi:hypothetical protein